MVSRKCFMPGAIMGENTRLHDGIAGALILLGTLLGYFLSPYWLAVPGVISALMLQSAFSGFCPVYFTLGKMRGRISRPMSNSGGF